MYDIWNNNFSEINDAYASKNYKSIELHKKDGYHYIFCSSNGIWFPNEKAIFQETILKKDRYEWQNINCTNAKKITYIRDIYKSWYILGINKEINSIDCLIDFIKKINENMQIIVIGSSSGGYLACLLGAKLNAKHVIAFSPQFNLYLNIDNNNSFIKRYIDDNNKNKYYNIVPIIQNSKTPIFYFLPIESHSDIIQYKSAKMCNNIRTLKVKSKNHGIVIYKENLSQLISLDTNQLDNIFNHYSNQIVSPFLFSVFLCGYYKTIIFKINNIHRYIRSKFKKLFMR